jgi:hypothetical protein
VHAHAPAITAEPAHAPAPPVAPAKAAEPAPAVAVAPAPAPAATASDDLPEEVADAAIVDEASAAAPVAPRAGFGGQIDIAGPGMLGTEIEIDIANIDADLLTGDASIDADLLSGDASIDADLLTGDAELDALLLDNGPADPERQAELAAEAETLVRPDTTTNAPPGGAGPPAIPGEPPARPASTRAPAGPPDALDDWLDDDLGGMDELSYSVDRNSRDAVAFEPTAVGRADGAMFADEPTALQPDESSAAPREVRGISDEPLPPLPIDGDAIPVMASDERASAMALPLHDLDIDGLDEEPDAAFELDDVESAPADAVLTRQPGAHGGAGFDAAEMPTHVPPDAESDRSPLDSALDELEFDAELEIEEIEFVEPVGQAPSSPAPAMPPPVASPSERVAAGTPPYSPQTPPQPPQAAQGYPTRPLTPVKPSPLPPSANRPALPGLPPPPGEPQHHPGQYPAVPSYPAPSTQPPPGYPAYPAMPQAPYVPAPAATPPGYPQAPSYPPSAYPQTPAHPQTQPQSPGYPQNPTYPVAPAEQQRTGDDDDDKKRGFFGRIFKK